MRFKDFLDYFYSLPAEERETFFGEVKGKYVEWTGVFVETWRTKIVVYGGDNYQNESWADMGTIKEKNAMIPYTYIGRFDSSIGCLKQGEPITVKGKLVSRGDEDLLLHWKLEEIEIVKEG